MEKVLSSGLLDSMAGEGVNHQEVLLWALLATHHDLLEHCHVQLLCVCLAWVDLQVDVFFENSKFEEEVLHVLAIALRLPNIGHDLARLSCLRVVHLDSIKLSLGEQDRNNVLGNKVSVRKLLLLG